MTTAGDERVLHAFRAATNYDYTIAGEGTLTALTPFRGELYGAATSVGDFSSIFAITPIGEMRTVYTSPSALNTSPLVELAGMLYGTASNISDPQANSSDAVSNGGIFALASSGTYRVLRTFTNDNDGSIGEGPNAAAMIVVGTTLYGTTASGGSHDAGTVFSVTPSGAYKTLHAFDSSKGESQSPSGLVYLNGKLYGTTMGIDGRLDPGTAFVISLDGTGFRVLHRFGSGRDGSSPEAGLIAVGNALYGTTSQGGIADAGTVYSLTTAGEERVLHAFTAGDDGAIPMAGLTFVGGMLYGTTAMGGTTQGGIAFSLTLDGTERVIHTFGTGADGWSPQATLLNYGGKLYGTTDSGGGVENAPKPLVVTAALRGASADVVIQPRYQSSLTNALVSYRVGGKTARLISSSGHLLRSGANRVRLVDVPGLDYPLLFVATLTVGKSSNFPDEPLIFRYDPSGPLLQTVPVIMAGDLGDSAPNNASCFTVSPKPIASDAELGVTFYAVSLPGKTLGIMAGTPSSPLGHGPLSITRTADGITYYCKKRPPTPRRYRVQA